MPLLVHESLVSKFAKDGFVVVPDMLTEPELELRGAAVDAAVAQRTRRDHRSLEQKTRYEQSFQQCLNLWEDHERVRPLSFHPKIGETAARLLGVPAVRIWHDQALYKQAGGRETDPHQDQEYWALAEADTITAWIPFDGSTLENGCMGYIPGSHRTGVRALANIFNGSGFDIENGPEAQGVPPVFVEVARGAVAFHHGLTIHLAGPNRTTNTRRVHTVIFFADGSTRHPGRRGHPCVDRVGIERGSPVASALTPIVWPRPEGDLPNPPPLPNPPLPGWPGWDMRRSERKEQAPKP